MTEKTQKENQETKKKRRWLKWVLIFALPLVLIAGGVGFYFNYVAAQEQDDSPLSMKNVHTMTIPSFSINLADAGLRRYLRTQIILEYHEGGWMPTKKKLSAELEQKEHRIKDVIINVLRSKRVNDLDTPEKVEAIRAELIKSINDLLMDGEVIGLYFKEFIIQ
ncbi:MAG: flagellar basal body-associated FliL family protein [Bacillota bacterium]